MTNNKIIFKLVDVLNSVLAMIIHIFNFLSCFLLVVDAVRLRVTSNNVENLVEHQISSFDLWMERDNISSSEVAVLVTVISTSPNHVSILGNDSYYFSSDDVENRRNKTVSVRAGDFGHGKIDIFTNQSNISKISLDIRIARPRRIVDIVFLAIIIPLITMNNINMGCILDLQILKQVFSKPIGPFVGFFSQFVFMPLASFGVASLLLDTPDLKLGLFALGCCPGGTGSNFWTLLFDGDINLSMVMTFVSSISALAMMPLWLFTLGEHFFQDVQVPYLNIIYTLIGFVVPVVVGICIRHWYPKCAAFLEKIIRPFTLVILIFFFTFGIYVNLFMFTLITWQIVVAGLCVALGGYLFGAGFAGLFCLKPNQVVAISIETAMQNPGIAFVLLQLSLPQPDADIASVAPMTQVFVTGIPLWFVYLGCWIRRRRKRRHEKIDEPLPVDVPNNSETSPPMPTDDLWISVPLQEFSGEEVKMIVATNDDDENVVWHRH